MTAALEGVRVLDLTRYIPGPYCAMILGDLGADVVKVEEPPFGDPTRALPPPVGDDSAAHAALNRNKRSLAVDLRTAAGVEVVRRLAARADVLLEAFRPGTLARRGLGFEALRAENPRLVQCSLTGYGQEGSHAARAGHDADYLALGGFLGTNCDREGRPVLPMTQVADMAGALVATIGILAALQARERTGQGQFVDASMLGGVAALMTVPATRRLAGREPGGSGGTAESPQLDSERGATPRERNDELTGAYACYRVYRCRDGRHLAVGALEPKFWEALCRALGLADRIGRQWDRGSQGRETITAFERAFGERDRDEWVEALRDVEACVEPVLDLDEAFGAGPAAALLAEQPSGARRLATPACPIRLKETPATMRRPAPGLGEHTQEVLAEAGYSSDQIAGMRESGAVA
jgi:crotonobetainyl-CoA:carnitine CoA-transferase CaiB-like acyl-CoA transferase